MKRHNIIIAAILIFLSINVRAQKKAEPAFEFLSTFPRVRDLALSEQVNEAWFTMQNINGSISVIFYSKKEAEKWGEPEVSSFSGRYKDLEPFLAPGGLRLWFASNRPLTGTGNPKDFDLWYVERQNVDSPWGEPVNAGYPVNTAEDEFYPCVTLGNNLYFTSTREGTKGEDDIFMSQWENGKYEIPVSLPESINSTGAEYNAWVSPDEKMIIFSGFNRADGIGNGDLYISRRSNSLQWEEAENMGTEVNSRYHDYSPFFDLQNNILYFTSNRISSTIQPPFSSLEEFNLAVNGYENGMLRLYKTMINDL